MKAGGKYTPFIGNLKDWSAPVAEVNTSENLDMAAGEGDDLPLAIASRVRLIMSVW